MIKHIILSILTVFTLGLAVVPNTMAINMFEGCNGPNKGTEVCKATSSDEAQSMVKSVISTILLILGMVAVVVIIIGGVMYTVSGGESGKIKTAKDTILYAVIGLIVAILAYAIVTFVLGNFI